MKRDSLVIESKSPRSKARLKSSRVDRLNDTPVDLENLSRKLLLLLLEKRLVVPLMAMGTLKRLERLKSTGMMRMTRLPSLRHLRRRIWQTRSRLRMLLSSTRLWRLLPGVKMSPL
jgi:hypothetical protein